MPVKEERKSPQRNIKPHCGLSMGILRLTSFIYFPPGKEVEDLIIKKLKFSHDE